MLITLTRNTGDMAIIRVSQIAALVGRESGSKVILNSGATISVAECPTDIGIIIKENL